MCDSLTDGTRQHMSSRPVVVNNGDVDEEVDVVSSKSKYIESQYS